MARNCGGQHQRRPRLSLMGLAVSTTLIRSLSLKSIDGPLYLHEPSSCGTAQLMPANIWPRGSGFTAQVTLANQQPMQGGAAAKPVYCLHIHLSLNPMGCFPFVFLQLSCLFSQFESLLFLFLSFRHHCLFGPHDPLLSFHTHTPFLSRK